MNKWIGCIKNNINNKRLLILFSFCIIIFFFVSIKLVYGEENQEHIKEFFERYLKKSIDSNEITIQMFKKNPSNPSVYFPQIKNYMEGASIKIGEFYYTIYFTNSPFRIYRFVDDEKEQKRLKWIKNIKDISTIIPEEEIFEKIKPILEYFELPLNKDAYTFQLPSARDFWRVYKEITYEGIPCRMAGFQIDVFSDTGEIINFVFIPLRTPVNRKPPLDTEKKAWDIAQEWLIKKNEEYFKIEPHPNNTPAFLDNTKKGRIVITFSVDAFTTSDDLLGERNYLYVWEIPFIWYDYGENDGVIWVDVETEQVIGAGPYKLEE